MPFPGDKLKSQHSCIHCVPFSLYFTMCAIPLLLIVHISPFARLFSRTELFSMAYRKISLIKFHKYSNGIFSFGSCLTKMGNIRIERERQSERGKALLREYCQLSLDFSPALILVVSRAFHCYCHCHYSFIRFIACSLLFIVL